MWEAEIAGPTRFDSTVINRGIKQPPHIALIYRLYPTFNLTRLRSRHGGTGNGCSKGTQLSMFNIYLIYKNAPSVRETQIITGQIKHYDLQGTTGISASVQPVSQADSAACAPSLVDISL